jgi:molecular chaperone DnaK
MQTSGLSEEEIARLVREAEASKLADRGKRNLADLALKVEGLLYSAERSLQEFGKLLSVEDRARVDRGVLVAKEALAAPSADKLQAALAALEGAAHKLSDLIYGAGS